MDRLVPPGLLDRYHRLDRLLTAWMARRGILLLRVSLGVVFLWFGLLKFFPGFSPAEALAGDTIERVTFGLLDRRPAVFVLATWESLIGLGLITGVAMRTTLGLLFVQMPGTVLPLFIFPELTFHDAPFVLTLEGQYIVKNAVLVSAGLVIGATVRGGRLSAEADPGDGPGEGDPAGGLRGRPGPDHPDPFAVRPGETAPSGAARDR